MKKKTPLISPERHIAALEADIRKRAARQAELERLLVVETEAAGDLRIELAAAQRELDDARTLATRFGSIETKLDATERELAAYRATVADALRELGLKFGPLEAVEPEPPALRAALDKLVPMTRNLIAERDRLMHRAEVGDARVHELGFVLTTTKKERDAATAELAGKADAESELAKTNVDLEQAEASCEKLIAEKRELEQKTRRLESRSTALAHELEAERTSHLSSLAAVHALANAVAAIPPQSNPT